MKTSALTYFGLVLGWTWLFWGASVLWGGSDDPSQSIVFLVGGAGPFLVAVGLTHLRESPAERRSFWVRSFDPRPLGWAWLAVALLVHPVIVAASFAVDVALGGCYSCWDGAAAR